MKSIGALLLLCTIVLTLPSRGLAQWQLDGTALSTAGNVQYYPFTVPDGAGGAIVVWYDVRSGSNFDIYAQRVSASGVPLWTADGVAISNGAGDQSDLAIIADGAGGAIITWDDTRSGDYDIYAQRVNAAGVPQWTANGVAVCTATFVQYYPKIIPDGAGGAIITWYDYRSGTADIYAQRVSASGVPQWTASGVALCTATNNQILPTIVSDGAAGAIVTWFDRRSGSYDIYAQRVNAAGAPQWTANGVALCTAASDQSYPTIVADGAGGAIVTWFDHRSGSDDIYAQRVNASGTPQWTANGVALCTAAGGQDYPTIGSDGAGGAIVTWNDYRSDPNSDIYAQRVSASGIPQWVADGVAICTASLVQYGAKIILDGAGGTIFTWNDARSGAYDIYVQRLTASGAPLWTANGLSLCTAGGDQANPTIAADGNGGAIVAWADYRDGIWGDIYAQRVEFVFGAWGHPEPLITSVSDVPGDQGGKVAVNWLGSDRDRKPPQVITHYSVWRAVDLAAFSARAGTSTVPRFVDASAIGPDFHGNAIRHERIATTNYYWEWVGNQDARFSAGNSLAVATREDSVASNPALHYFQVLAHTSDPYVFWESNVMGGHSVDNHSLAAPPLLTLAPNVPNPFNPITTIRYDVTVGGADVSIVVFDVAGRRVRTLVDEHRPAGVFSVQWNGDDDRGQRVASGVYFYRMRAGGFVDTKKMVLLK